jgi:hypothetical protein
MGKMKDILLSEQQSALSVTEANFPAISDEVANEFKNFERAGGSVSLGERMRFTKAGEYETGQDKRVIPLRSWFIALMHEEHHGYVLWKDKHPVDETFVRVKDGPPPTRESLGDNDRAMWEVDSSGKARDPWQFTYCLPILSLEGEEVLTFIAATKGSIQAVERLNKRHARFGPKHYPKLPIIEFERDSYPHRDFGKVWYPILSIVDWADLPGARQEDAATNVLPATAPPALEKMCNFDSGRSPCRE